MKNSFEHHSTEERLDPGSAHEEANMVRAVAEGASAEDYDHALALIEKLKAAAEDESGFEKTANNIMRGASGVAIDLLFRVGLFGSAMAPGNARRWTEGTMQEHDERLKWLKEHFVDAEEKLKRAKEAGEKFGQSESGNN